MRRSELVPDPSMDLNAQLPSAETDKGTRRKLIFCTYERCPEGLNFQPGCWNKPCYGKSKFYNKKHQCGTQENGSTYSYFFMDVALQQGWRFVAKNTAEAVKASHAQAQPWSGFQLKPET